MILRWIYQKKKKLFAGTEGYFGAKSKSYNTAMKRTIKEHLLGCEIYSGTRGLAQKER